MREHWCHALSCEVPVSPRLFMCLKHWRALPLHLRRAVLAAYVPGQERTKRVTPAYLQAAAQAIVWLATKEGQDIPALYVRMAAGETERMVEQLSLLGEQEAAREQRASN